MNLFNSDVAESTVIFDTSKVERKLFDEYKVIQRKLKPKWKFIEYI